MSNLPGVLFRAMTEMFNLLETPVHTRLVAWTIMGAWTTEGCAQRWMQWFPVMRRALVAMDANALKDAVSAFLGRNIWI